MKKSIIIVIMATFTCPAFAQTISNETEKKSKLGFNFGINHSLLQSKNAIPKNAVIYNGFGTRLGLIMDCIISKKLHFSPKIEMAFNESGVITTNSDNTTTTYKIFPNSLEIMSHLVYKIGKGKAIPYLMLGPNFRTPVVKEASSSSNFKNKSDLAIDFGIGLENRLKHFSYAPEIRYSLGLLNINKNPTIPQLNYHSISMVLNFK
jgi:hypothetical protein